MGGFIRQVVAYGWFYKAGGLLWVVVSPMGGLKAGGLYYGWFYKADTAAHDYGLVNFNKNYKVINLFLKFV